jgi:hypothetical protein
LKKILVFLIIASIFYSCDNTLNDDKGSVLARVEDVYLYEDDIRNIVPAGISARDSLMMTRNYINNWVKTELMIQQARRNLAVQQLDLESQLEDYRNSLIIYHYETELIKQKLDTLVSDDEITTYYHANLSDFELKENIARLYYVIIDNEPELEESLDQVYSLPDSILIDSLEVFCEQYARACFLDTATWLRFDDIVDIVPLETYNQELFLQQNRKIRLSDDRYTYLLTFVDFRIEEDTSPLDFKMEDIRTIIINKRKVDLVKQVRQEIYHSALESGKAEIYLK